jgi:hypothetical protein
LEFLNLRPNPLFLHKCLTQSQKNGEATGMGTL